MITSTNNKILRLANEVGQGQIFTAKDAYAACGEDRQNTVIKSLHDLVARGDLAKAGRGLYYLPFQVDGIDMTGVYSQGGAIKRLWIDDVDKTIGYVSGPALAAEFGFQTMLPAKVDVYTNNWRKCTSLSEQLNVRLHKPKEPVTNENAQELRLLDSLVDSSAFDCDDEPALIAQAVKNLGLSFKSLLARADRQYPQDVFLRVARSFYTS